jgi:hypothetical protein
MCKNIKMNFLKCMISLKGKSCLKTFARANRLGAQHHSKFLQALFGTRCDLSLFFIIFVCQVLWILEGGPMFLGLQTRA